MTELVLTEDQANLLASAAETVQVRDTAGNLLGVIEPIDFSAEEIAEAKRAAKADATRFTTEQVLAHLQSMEGQ